MALLTWNSKYSVGVQAMDSQHTQLFDMVNDLHAAMMQGKAQSVTGPLLRKLADYTQRHFTAEEALMASKSYPELTKHKAEHVALTKQVSDFVGRFEKGENTLSLHLMNFLRDWLMNHIQKEDQKYGVFLNKLGVK
jgi:hemerythrin-like metal-binding protein